MRPALASLLATLLLATIAPGLARAQERGTEQTPLVHVFDQTPHWETTESLVTVQLEAPSELAICRQGQISVLQDHRAAHMGCWPHAASGASMLDVPAGPGFLAVRRGIDVTWLGNGATTLAAGDTLRVVLDDRLPVRIAGWITAGVGLVAGAALVAIAFAVPRAQTELTITGAATAVVGLVVGFALTTVGDGLQLTVVRPTPPGP